MTDIEPGDDVIITARVALVITTKDGQTRVKIDTDELDWIPADRCMVIGKDES